MASTKTFVASSNRSPRSQWHELQVDTYPQMTNRPGPSRYRSSSDDQVSGSAKLLLQLPLVTARSGVDPIKSLLVALRLAQAVSLGIEQHVERVFYAGPSHFVHVTSHLRLVDLQKGSLLLASCYTRHRVVSSSWYGFWQHKTSTRRGLPLSNLRNHQDVIEFRANRARSIEPPSIGLPGPATICCGIHQHDVRKTRLPRDL